MLFWFFFFYIVEAILISQKISWRFIFTSDDFFRNPMLGIDTSLHGKTKNASAVRDMKTSWWFDSETEYPCYTWFCMKVHFRLGDDPLWQTYPLAWSRLNATHPWWSALLKKISSRSAVFVERTCMCVCCTHGFPWPSDRTWVSSSPAVLPCLPEPVM